MANQVTILIADDTLPVLTLIEVTLSQSIENIKTITASNGLEAFEKAKTYRPDVILIDYQMPVMNGLEALGKMKETPELADIPVIMITSHDGIEEAFKAGAVDFIKKPFTETELLSRVNYAIKLLNSIKKIKSQNEELREQRNLIEQRNKELLEDMRYARLIQNAILPKKTILDQLLKDYFILNLPKNIVSGDFYWVEEKNQKLLFAIGDSTGHGVSGAFMQMMGSVFLNEINSSLDFPEPNIILDKLRDKIIKILNEEGTTNKTKDGMDIAFCVIDKDTRMLHFAGANNPLYIIRDKEIHTLKADRMPVGYYELKDQPFSKTEFQLQKGDVIYGFTDGYADQFGGSRNKKFRYNRFQDLLLDIYQLPMEEQYAALLKSFINWKRDLEQIDDILVLGYKVE